MLSDLEILFERELAAWQREIALFPDDESVWATLPGLPNSAGTLTLHICGNLNHFLGAILGGTGYVRDRDKEFSASGIPRHALIGELRNTTLVVTSAIRTIMAVDLDRTYPIAVGKGVEMSTRRFLIHLYGHLSYHLGQVDYARRAVTGDATSATTFPLEPLGEGE